MKRPSTSSQLRSAQNSCATQSSMYMLAALTNKSMLNRAHMMQVIASGYASPVGLSIFLVNALRSVGIPARVVGELSRTIGPSPCLVGSWASLPSICLPFWRLPDAANVYCLCSLTLPDAFALAWPSRTRLISHPEGDHHSAMHAVITAGWTGRTQRQHVMGVACGGCRNATMEGQWERQPCLGGSLGQELMVICGSRGVQAAE